LLVPGKEGEIISRKGAVVDRDEFEKMKGEYYQLRGWDVASGFQTKAKLKEVGLQDITEDLESRGLVI
jgi:aldehyde:ferredoxin oxidoreductase